MARRRVERELMRGAGPIAVLRLLEQREMYGYELIEALSRRTGGVLAMGQSTLYTLLYNLEGKKLVGSRWRTAESGRKRKYYGPTEKGLAYLRSKEREWARLVGALAGLGLLEVETGEK
jgi:PadR family transcriptional regulator PadR